MIAQEGTPLAGIGNLRCALEHPLERADIFLTQSHIHARHERKMEIHVQLIPLREVGQHIFWPLVGFPEQNTAGKIFLQKSTHFF